MKKILIFLLIIVIGVGITGCVFSTKNNILKKIELEGLNCELQKEINTHRGFLGDKSYFVMMKCLDLNSEKLSKNWKKLPLNDELNTAMEMIQCTDDECKNVYERYEIPNIKNGYYYFLDRHSESKDRYDSSDLNNRFSWNFTLALLDVDKNIIYYYELDT